MRGTTRWGGPTSPTSPQTKIAPVERRCKIVSAINLAKGGTRLVNVKDLLGWGGRVKMFALEVAFKVPEIELYLHLILQPIQNIPG